MTKYFRVIIFTIITLYTQIIFCQNQDSINKINEARILFNNAGRYMMRGMNTEAKDTFLAALELRKSEWGDIVPELASNYLYLGIVYGRLVQSEQSLKYYMLAEECAMLNEDNSIRQLEAIYNNVGNIYFDRLDYINALKYYEQSISYYKKAPESINENFYTIKFNIANIYYYINEYDKSIEIIRESINKSDTLNQIFFYELLAKINQEKGNLTEAFKNYEKAIELSISKNGEKSLGTSNTYLNYSLLLIRAKQFDLAENMLEKAYQIIKTSQSEYGYDLSLYYWFKGDLEKVKPFKTEDINVFKKQKRSNILKSIENYKNGLFALRFPKNYLKDSLINTDNLIDKLQSLDLLKKIGDSYLELSETEATELNKAPEGLTEAIEHYEVVSSLIQQARKEITNDASKIQLTSLQYETFIKMVQSAHSAYYLTNDAKYVNLAFQNAEQTKGSALFDKIADQFALDNSLIPDSLLELQVKWNNTINEYSQKEFEESNKSEPDNTLIDEYKSELLNATSEREKINRYIETTYSDFYELKYSNSTLSVNELQKKIKEDQVVLEYILNETDTIPELFIFLISKNEIGFYKSNVTADFISSIEDMFKFMASSDYFFTRNEHSKKFCIASHQLYASLIEPIENKIREKNLIIIPDGKLSYIPFEALIESLPDTTQMIEFNKLNYLIKDYCINYSVSANLLFRKSKDSNKANVRTVAFAPTYNHDTIEVAGRKLVLNPLPGVQKEVDNISGIVKTKVFKENEATEANFLNNIANFDILHLAMHAFINDSLPAFSSMAFAQNVAGDNQSTGLLNTADIYGLKLKAKLAVLSACNTGTGKLLKGEGIMSLARGFLYAGCPSIIMSLWEVDDNSGTEIMSSFYKYLKKGKSKDQALRQAKLEYLESANSREAHPHYWLSFVNIGESTPLFISHDFYFFIILVLALSGIGIDQLIRIKKARNKRA